MVRFTVHNLGEHVVDGLSIYGPNQQVVQAMLDIFLATSAHQITGDLELAFVNHLIAQAYGQGRILDYQAPEEGSPS